MNLELLTDRLRLLPLLDAYVEFSLAIRTNPDVVKFICDTAKKDEVLVMRRDQRGHTFVIELDIAAALSGKDLSQNIQLHPYDFVQVPRAFW